MLCLRTMGRITTAALTDRGDIFAGDDPLVILRSWLAEAERSEPNDPNAMVLSTADAEGLPDSRVVLLKEVDTDGLVFFTNYESRKAEQLDASGKAAANLHWKSLGRQIRVRGMVSRIDAAASDDYYASRPLGSRIGAWASAQSRPLKSKAALMKAVAAAGIRHGAHPKRPPFWGGYRLRPVAVEFWAAGEFRLHDRFLWTQAAHEGAWHIQRLSP